MSPTEDDLRRTLADGDGEVPSAALVIGRAHRQRERRRRTLLSAAAAVVVVGGVAAGVAALADNDGSGRSSSGADRSNGSEAARNSVAGGAAGDVPNASGPQTSAGTTQQVGCPASDSVSGNRSLGPSSSPGSAMFAQPVESVLVCAYRDFGTSPIAGAPPRVALHGHDAEVLATSLENASRTKPVGACPAIAYATQRTILVLARSSSGRSLPTVRTTINEVPCGVQVTNGSAVRYAWTWPQALASSLAELSGTPSTTGSSPSR